MWFPILPTWSSSPWHIHGSSLAHLLVPMHHAQPPARQTSHPSYSSHSRFTGSAMFLHTSTLLQRAAKPGQGGEGRLPGGGRGNIPVARPLPLLDVVCLPDLIARVAALELESRWGARGQGKHRVEETERSGQRCACVCSQPCCPRSMSRVRAKSSGPGANLGGLCSVAASAWRHSLLNCRRVKRRSEGATVASYVPRKGGEETIPGSGTSWCWEEKCAWSCALPYITHL